ncbi:MAG: homocysteine S-methyltransferase family protein [Phycisphaeraceae bacterium]
MTRSNLLETLRQRPLLCDGAMGTQLIARGLTGGACAELWNVQQPQVIAAIHTAYLTAGCAMITTNTFGACSAALTRHGLGERTAELNRAGAKLARKAADDAGGERWVLGDIGPFGDFLEPLGEMTLVELEAIFRQQAAALYEGGADGVIVETMVDPAESAAAIRAAKAVNDWPVIATFAFNRVGDGVLTFRTVMGVAAGDAVRQAIAAGADIVGANCGTSLSLEDYAALSAELVQAAGDTPVIVQPNAGSPSMVDGQLRHPAKPHDMAAAIPCFLKAGVRVIGGCCGTTPAHLQAMAATMGQRGATA